MSSPLFKNRRNMRYFEWSVLIVLFFVFLFVFYKHLDEIIESSYDSSVKGLAGSLKSGIFLVKSQWMLSGATNNIINLHGYGDNDIDVNSKGFPVSSQSNLGQLKNDLQCIEIWKSLIRNSPSISISSIGITSLKDNNNFSAKFESGKCYYTHLRSKLFKRVIRYDPENGEVKTFTYPVQSES